MLIAGSVSGDPMTALLEMTRGELAATFTWAGLVLLFLVAKFMARYTVVYRRNNVGIVVALALSAFAFYAWGWIGLLSFVLGNLVGAWTWISEVKSANARFDTLQADADRRRSATLTVSNVPNSHSKIGASTASRASPF
jgi:hypothetical protein